MSIDVIKLAREAAQGRHANNESDAHSLRADELPRFAALVLEEAEKACKEISDQYAYHYYGSEVDAVDECRAAIRALKPQE